MRTRTDILNCARCPAWRPSPSPLGPVQPSGIAFAGCDGVIVADTAGNRLVRMPQDCRASSAAGTLTARASAAVAEFHAPAGLCVGPGGWLFLADSGASRILVLTVPDLVRRAVWSAGLRAPVAVAADGELAVLVADPGRGQVLRFDRAGRPDAAFNDRLAPPVGPAAPRAVAVGPDGIVYIGSSDVDGVARFDRSGQPGGAAIAANSQPTALAVAGAVIYVADARSGLVTLYELPLGRELGPVGGYRGPVSALAAAPDGRVWIMSGLDGGYHLASRAAPVSSAER